MGYDLIAKKKDVDTIAFGAFIWPVMLQDTGMGYVLGYGASMSPGGYVYKSGNNGSPSSNDGYKVSSTEAKAMAMVARGYVSVKRYINKEWESLEEIERKEKANAKFNGKNMYELETGDSFLKAVEKFAEFAEKSGGFTIN